MQNKLHLFFLLFIATILFSSCGVNKDIMFRTPKEYSFDELNVLDSLEYQISANDVLSFRLFTNDGFKLIDITGGSAQNANSGIYRESSVSYLVESDGLVKLPTLGRINITGMNIKEAEQFLEDHYSEYYKDPFVLLKVLNKRAIVSTGAGGSARVIELENNNITLIEALALAGGIDTRGNASKIKIIREGNREQKVFSIDLSTIEGIQQGGMIIQANDVIYVEPVPRLGAEIAQELAPIVSLITSTFFIYRALTLSN